MGFFREIRSALNEIFAVKFKEADWKDEAYPAIGELLLYSGGTFRIHWISAR